MTPFELMTVFVLWLLAGAGVLTTGITMLDGPWWLRLGVIILGAAILWGCAYWFVHVTPPLPPGTHIIVV